MTSTTQLAEWIRESKRAVAFTGAGISTESGIPDFRSPAGVWSQNRQVYFDEFLQSSEARHEYWRQKAIAHVDFAKAGPNAGHQALAAWETRGLIRGVITQNIDGLHQQAGNRNVLELHGTAREIACLSCSWRTPADGLVRQFLETKQVPECPQCGGLLKHATISFGQSLDDDTLQAAGRLAEQADLFLAIGSSLVVHPAAGLPKLAKFRGARLVIINRDATPLDEQADLVINEPIGQTLGAVESLMS